MERFYTWPLIVERKVGVDNRGNPAYGPETTEMCRIRMVSELVATSDGKEVTSRATASMSSTTAQIPVDSRVKLPPELSAARTGYVASEGLHDTRIPGVPAFYQIQIAGGA